MARGKRERNAGVGKGNHAYLEFSKRAEPLENLLHRGAEHLGRGTWRKRSERELWNFAWYHREHGAILRRIGGSERRGVERRWNAEKGRERRDPDLLLHDADANGDPVGGPITALRRHCRGGVLRLRPDLPTSANPEGSAGFEVGVGRRVRACVSRRDLNLPLRVWGVRGSSQAAVAASSQRWAVGQGRRAGTALIYRLHSGVGGGGTQAELGNWVLFMLWSPRYIHTRALLCFRFYFFKKVFGFIFA